MPPSVVKENMVQDLIDFMHEAVPSFEATLEVLELVLESDRMTSRVAKSHRRWIHICLMQQLLQLKGEEREEWIVELFDGKQCTAELFAEKMCEDGIWIEEEDEYGRTFYSIHRQKERNLRHYLLRPDIQHIYKIEVMQLLPLIEKESIEGSDHPPKKGSASYKVVAPDWRKEVIATRKQLAQSQSLVLDLQREVSLANEVIATQKKALEGTNEQLKVAHTANARLEQAWLKRYKKFFRRTWK